MTDNTLPTYWFPAKRYGWGWGLPIAWQGWVVFAIWIAAVIAIGIGVAPRHPAVFFVLMTIMTVLIIAICWMKGEPPRWRWG